MTDPIDAPPPPAHLRPGPGGQPAKKYTAVDYLFQLVTITAGVLIALLIGGLVEWNNRRELVAQARATINQEIAANRKDLEVTLSGIERDLEHLDEGIQLANDILAKKPILKDTMNFHLNLADLTMSGWRTAERTGALSHMDYGEVQRLSILYDQQELLVAQPRGMLNLLSEAMSILAPGFDPDRANFDDVERFRERMMRLRSILFIHRQLATRLAEGYGKALQP